MLFRTVAARTARATVTVAVVATGAMTVVPALLAGPAQAATLTKPVVKLLTGVNQQVACLSKALCVVVGYDDSSVGDVVAVRNGVPGHVSVVRHTARLYSASCPNHSGCVALADPHSGVNAEFVAISKSGVVTSAKVVADASGDTINTISCRELTSCEVAGYNFFTNAIVAGTWNGRKLTLRSETAPKGSSDVGSSALACYGASCELVGDALRGTATTIGLSLTLNGTKLGKIRVSPGDVFGGVSCASKSVCYASGYSTTAAGIIVTIKNGAPGSSSPSNSDLFGIACDGSKCTAVGEETPPPTSPDAFWGTLVSVAAGKVTGTTVFEQSGGLDGVARIGTFYAAAGSSHAHTKDFSLVITG
jgi:hypothetical protein